MPQLSLRISSGERFNLHSFISHFHITCRNVNFTSV